MKADWRQRKYDEVFERVVRHAEDGRRSGRITLADLEGLLRTEYVNQGNDWTGKGALHDTVQAATIAAYEHVLAEWRKE